MKNRDFLAGLGIAALLLATMFWVRGRPAHTGAASPGGASVIPSDVTQSPGSVDLGDARLILSLSPRPVAFERFRARVRVESTAKSATPETLPLRDARITFQMRMPMGDHRYTLLPGADASLEADLVLPMCGSGERRWFATVEGTLAGRPITARYQFDISPPGTASK